MPINFHDANNKYTYAQRNAHISWRNDKNITDIQNKRIIDIGCGGGIYTKELALMGAKVLLGLIFQKKYYKLQKDCSGFSNISFIHGDAHSTPYPNDTFDIVISRAVIHHLQDIPTFLRASRILKKNGVLIVQDRTIEDCTIPGSPEHIRGYFFSIFPKLIEIESKDDQNHHDTTRITKIFSSRVPTQTQWEVRKIHESVEALLQDIPPTGRSILYELTDYELSQLLQQVQTALQNVSPIIERDRWTIWSAMKL